MIRLLRQLSMPRRAVGILKWADLARWLKSLAAKSRITIEGMDRKETATGLSFHASSAVSTEAPFFVSSRENETFVNPSVVLAGADLIVPTLESVSLFNPVPPSATGYPTNVWLRCTVNAVIRVTQYYHAAGQSLTWRWLGVEVTEAVIVADTESSHDPTPGLITQTVGGGATPNITALQTSAATVWLPIASRASKTADWVQGNTGVANVTTTTVSPGIVPNTFDFTPQLSTSG